jgi:hypothetical protein
MENKSVLIVKIPDYEFLLKIDVLNVILNGCSRKEQQIQKVIANALNAIELDFIKVFALKFVSKFLTRLF